MTETEVISQAASENTEPVKKRGRGRPRLMNELVQSIVDRSWPGHTERTQRSNYWRIEAIGALKPHEEFGWLLDEKHLKKSLLTQLGYIPDAELMRTVARFLCERKPKTKYAERCLRSWRRSLKWETWCKLAQTGFPADDAAGEKFLCDYRQDGERLLREEFYEEFYADEISEAASKNEGVSNE